MALYNKLTRSYRSSLGTTINLPSLTMEVGPRLCTRRLDCKASTAHELSDPYLAGQLFVFDRWDDVFLVSCLCSMRAVIRVSKEPAIIQRTEIFYFESELVYSSTKAPIDVVGNVCKRRVSIFRSGLMMPGMINARN